MRNPFAVLLLGILVGCSGVNQRPLLFQAQRPGDSEDIYVFDRGMRKVQRLTRGGEHFANSFPTWSPVAEQIAFVRQADVDALFILDVPRAELRQLETPDVARLGPPAWSPDGRFLLISAGADNPSRRLYQVDVDSSAYTELPLPSGMIDCGTYSPDGTQVVATRMAADQSQILLLDLRSLEVEILVASDSVAYHCPEWSPEGGSIGVTQYSRSSAEAVLVLVDLEGNVKSVPAGTSFNNAFKWSPDGKWIAYQCTQFTGTPEDPGFYRAMEICLVRPDGSGLRRLTENNYFDAHPSW